MRVIIVNRYFFPDQSATSRIAYSLAVQLFERDCEVHVLTARNFHDAPQKQLPATEIVGGVAVRRMGTTRFGRNRLWGRAADYLTFHLSAIYWLLRLARRDTICIICTDPPLLSVSALLPIKLRRAILVNWILDLFPEVAIDLNVVGARSPLTRLTLWLRDLSLRAARWNVAPMRRMTEFLVARGIPAERVTTLNHWSEGSEIQPIGRTETRLRADWGLGDKTVIGYSGNLGRAHEFGTILDAAEGLLGRTDIVFLFVGGGYRREWVQREVERRGLTNVIMKPLQPRDRLSESLAVADVHLVSLLPEMEPYIVPSKFYGIAAAGRPTLFVGDPQGEIARLVAQGECGAAVPIGAVSELSRWIVQLADSPVLREQMATNARRLFEANFTEARAIPQWLSLLKATEDSGGAALAASITKG